MTTSSAINYENPLPIDNKNKHLNICIIGAGVSGICTGKHLLEYGFKNITIFEQHDKMGGIWYYNRNPKFPNAMYPSLHTNFPISFMKFPDFAFPNNTPLYPPYSTIYKYMESYINTFNVSKYIKLNHKIINIEPPKEIEPKWNVEYIVNNNYNTEYGAKFDFVIICNGHFRHCRYPKYQNGFNNLSTPYIHSQSYRGIDDINSYKNKTILIIGSGNTASDIVQDLVPSKICKKIYHSTSIWKFELKFGQNKLIKYKNYYMIKPTVKLFDNINNRVIFENNEYIDNDDIDLIIFATGYDYHFEFIDLNKNDKLYHLYQHMFCAYYPSLIYMSLPINGLTFVTTHFQAIWLSKILCDMKFKNNQIISKYLPLKQEMIQNATNNDKHHEFAIVGGQLFKYLKLICKNAEIESPVNEIRLLFKQWFTKQIPNIMQKIFVPRVVFEVIQGVKTKNASKL